MCVCVCVGGGGGGGGAKKQTSLYASGKQNKKSDLILAISASLA